MTIVDYVIIGIVAIAFLIGIIKGFSGMFFGFISVLVSLGIAIAATMPIAAALAGTQDTLSETINAKLTEGTEQNLFTYEVYKVKNSETEQYELYMKVPAETEGDYEVMKFEDALDKVGDGFMGTVMGLASTPIQNAIMSNLEVGEGQENAAPFASYVSHIFAGILLKVITFIVLFVVSLILFRILASLSDKLLEFKAIRVIDKILGAIICTGIAAGIVAAVIVLAYTYLGTNEMVAGYLNSSTIASAIRDSGIVEKLFGIALPAAEEAAEPENVEAFAGAISKVINL